MKGLLIILVCGLFAGCYGLSKAKKGFGRAVTTYPEIGADYCARTYPAKDTFIKGKDSVRVDTLWGQGEVTIVRDTLRNRDTIFIKTVQQLPGKVIERTIFRTDTVYQENTAALDLCEIERRSAILAADREHKEMIGWKGKAKKRFWIIAGMGLVIALGLFGFLRKKITRLK